MIFACQTDSLIDVNFKHFCYLLKDFTCICSVGNSHNGTTIEALNEEQGELGMKGRMLNDFEGAGTTFWTNGYCHGNKSLNNLN
jgi:hypothetical protein